MRSTGNYSFSRVPHANIPRSTFNRDHGYKTTFDAGYLVPFFLDEILPGDTFSVRATLFGRLATPFVPVMDNMFLDAFFFFVPYRLLWSNWTHFMGELEDPDLDANPDYIVPTLVPQATGFPVHSIADYFGLPLNAAFADGLQAFPFRAYNLIWNEWFRDENLQNKVPVQRDDGPDAWSNYTYNPGDPNTGLLRRNKRHDYFTSSLPWPQKGPGVMLPLGTTAPVIADPDNTNPSGTPSFKPALGGGTADAHLAYGASNATVWNAANAQGTVMGWDQPGLIADLSNASAATINSLRMAFQIQKLYERDARGGTRYTEILSSHFGVTSPDSRLQRPEYLGGGSTRINVHPVSQTSGSPQDSTGYTTTPQGNLAAFGTVAGGMGFTKSFVEHGLIIGLLEVRADITYQDGIDRFWKRQTKFDFYWPALAHLGEQAVLKEELFYDNGDPAYNAEAWGYQERWAEYRYKPSKVTGLMRSQDNLPAGESSLDVWHLAQNLTNLGGVGVNPILNGLFIQDAPPIKRISAVPSEPDFILDSYIACRCTRPMPVYSVPGMIDHF